MRLEFLGIQCPIKLRQTLVVDGFQGKRSREFRKARVRRGVLSTAAFENPAREPGLGFRFDPFLDKIPKLLAQICDGIQTNKLEMFQSRLRRGYQVFERGRYAHEKTSWDTCLQRVRGKLVE